MSSIDIGLAKRLLARSFPRWASLPLTPVECQGHDNTTFRLGETMSLRFPNGSSYAAHVPNEFEWLPRLAAKLPVAIPQPLAMGEPARGYPWPWLVNKWIVGKSAASGISLDQTELALSLSEFLTHLHMIDSDRAPKPSADNFYRGGDLSVYAEEAFGCMRRVLQGNARHEAQTLFQAALESRHVGNPVWVHGDLAADNLIVREGRLCGVIDFGQLAAGDPACDLTIAWTFLAGEARRVFQSTIAADEATWCRARGWALWKALLELEQHRLTNQVRAQKAARVIDCLLGEYLQIHH